MPRRRDVAYPQYTSASGAVASPGAAHIRAMLQAGEPHQRVRAAITRTFPSLSPAAATQAYETLNAPYAAAKSLRGAAPGFTLRARDIPIRNPPPGSFGLGAQQGYHYNATVEVTFPGAAAPEYRQVVVHSYTPLSVHEIGVQSRWQYLRDIQQEDHPFAAIMRGGPPTVSEGIAREIHRVTR